MVQKTDSFLETKWGWDFGEDNWNTGMDENLVKFSALIASGIDGIVSTLPVSPTNGQAYFNTTDNRFYLRDGDNWYNSPVPLYYEFKDKSNGNKYTFNGTGLVLQPDPLPTLALDTGSNLVGFKQSGTGSVSSTVYKKNQERTTVQDFGGVDDGITDNAAAFLAAKAKVGTGGSIYLPKITQGKYLVNSNIDLSGVVLIPDDGVSIVSNSLDLKNLSNTRLRNDLTYSQTTPIINYLMSPSYNKPAGSKSSWLGEADVKPIVNSAVALASLKNESILWDTSDTWASASPTLNTSTQYQNFVNWGSGAASTWYASTITVRGGDEIQACWQTGGDYKRFAVVRTTAGYYGVYVDQGAVAPRLVTKLTSVASTTTIIADGTSVTTQPQYYGSDALWTIKIYNRRQFSVMFNGFEVTGIITTAGDIYRAGFGYMPGVATAVSVSAFTLHRNAPVRGKRDIICTIYGDSMSAPILGSYSSALRETLDYSYGIRVGNIINYAVGGYTSSQVLTAMTTNGVTGQYCIVPVGTNDIQGQTGISLLLNNMASMVTIITAAGAKPIFWIPPMWYTQTEAGAGKGQASGNSNLGSSYRQAIANFCGANGYAFLDGTKVSGVVDSKFLNNTSNVANADSGMRDNIHGTAAFNNNVGREFAKLIVTDMASLTTRANIVSAPNANSLVMTGQTFSNGYVNNASPADMRYSSSSDGLITLQGAIDGAAATLKTDGATLVTLPEHLWSPVNLPFSVAVLKTDNTFATMTIIMNNNGTLNGYSIPSNVSKIYLSNMTWQGAN